jgi:hypothetical protein
LLASVRQLEINYTDNLVCHFRDLDRGGVRTQEIHLMTKSKTDSPIAPWLDETVDSEDLGDVSAFRDWIRHGAKDKAAVWRAINRGWALVLDGEDGVPRAH